MTTTALPYGDKLDLSNTVKVPFGRLVRIELRKMVDTRAGMWLLIAIAVITGLATVIFGLAGHAVDRNYGNFAAFAGVPQAFLLPVLGILLITQEWGQRTAMVTFTLEPHRGRILTAKIVAALILSMVAFVIALGFAALSTLAFGGPDRWSNFKPLDIATIALAQGLGTLQGLSYGLLLLSSASAIVAFFVVPRVIALVTNLWPLLSDKAPWLDFGTAQGALYGNNSPSATQWAQILVTGTVWVILPFTIGLWRMLRAEVK
jgi:ABC-2 type transport system permease protein